MVLKLIVLHIVADMKRSC